ncbi:MAG TPA: trigger factor [Solirubrobacteraceae bacterium]|nr:trigger factor [Solirubrobacteraceae bacterium]
MKTTVTELPESRVRVEAEVPPEEVAKRVEQTARALGRDLRIPGFRAGKVPAPVVIRRLGHEAVLDETVRSALGRWYVEAVQAAKIAPVGDPDIKLGDELPAEGQPLTFSIEIGVRPKATLGEYKGLEVGRREPDAADDAIEREIDALRDRAARLDTVEGATAENGDFVVMDYKGFLDGEPFEGGEGRDQLIELGSGRLIPGFEEGLTGAKAGDELKLDLTFPAEYGAEHLAGQDAVFEVTVKEVKRKELPELNDDFALEAAGFDTLDELRTDIRNRLEESESTQIEGDFRQAVLDSAVQNAEVDVPEALVDARARELFDQAVHSLSHRGISKDIYLQISGKTEDELVEEGKPDAEQALKREAVLTAIVAAENIDVTDDEVLEAIAGESDKPKKLLQQIKSDGRIDQIKEDLAARKAVDLLVESAQAVSVEDAKAAGKLFTPEKAEGEPAA